MRTENVSGVGASTGAGLRPDRRAFLRVGAGCAVPLLAGGVLASRGLAGTAETAGADSIDQDAVDPMLAHVEQELARTYHAMRGPAGVRGEHVRSLAANLDLIGVCLRARSDDTRADAAFRRTLEDRGRDAAAQECVAAFNGLAADLSQQYGIVPHGARRVAQMADALDSVAAKGLVTPMQGHRAALNRLAASLDRAEAMRGMTAKRLAVRQKPGDDFLGYPPWSPSDHLTLCDVLRAQQYYLEVMAAILAIISAGAAPAVLALAALLYEGLMMVLCRKDEEL